MNKAVTKIPLYLKNLITKYCTLSLARSVLGVIKRCLVICLALTVALSWLSITSVLLYVGKVVIVCSYVVHSVSCYNDTTC